MKLPGRVPNKILHKKIILFAGLAVGLLLLGIGLSRLQPGTGKESTEEEIERGTSDRLVAAKDIQYGEKVTRDMVQIREMDPNDSEGVYLTEAELGKTAVIAIEQGTPITRSMVSNERLADDIREEGFGTFYLSSNLKTGDVIDLRILYPNGEDYIVLAKKTLKELNLDQSHCYLWLNEEELLSISSAIVDAYLHAGTRLYTVKYIEPNVQKASIANYQPLEDVIRLMDQDPNLASKAKRAVEAGVRAALDERLALAPNMGDEGMYPGENGDGGSNDNPYENENKSGNEKDSSGSETDSGKDASVSSDGSSYQVEEDIEYVD